MAFCPKCRQTMDSMDTVCPHCGYDFPDTASDDSQSQKPRRHFIILVIGSLLFLVCFISQTFEVIVWSSNPGEAAVKNTAALLHGLQQLGVYLVFVALLFGHRWLRSARPRR
jgi:uncharacterized membrane protein YvbJ